MLVKFGTRELELGGNVVDANLRSSNDLLGNLEAVRQRFKEDGYLLFRQLIPRDVVIRGRQAVVDEINAQGGIKPGTDPMDAYVLADSKHPHIMGRKEITHRPAVRAVLEAKELFDFYKWYFGRDVLTFDYKWMRAVRPPENTGAHYDVVYMGRGTTSNLRTTWIPFGDIEIKDGPLALCVGSHNLPGFQRFRDTYGKSDVDAEPVKGWLSNDPQEVVEKFGGKWQTSTFRMGDVLIFGMFTLHSSLTNTTLDRYRISADVRYQPADDPVDDRWIGENPKAHYVWSHTPAEKMADMVAKRQEWGV